MYPMCRAASAAYLLHSLRGYRGVHDVDGEGEVAEVHAWEYCTDMQMRLTIDIEQ